MSGTIDWGSGGRVIFINSTNSYKFSGITNKLTGEVVNDLTGSIAVKDLLATTLHTGSVDYVSGSDGDYRVIIPVSVTEDLIEGTEYILEFTLNWGSHQTFIKTKVLATTQRAA